MSRKAIIFIIILMSASLIGVAIIQWFWIKWAVDLDEKSFDDHITIALSRVKDRLEDDALLYFKNTDFRLGADDPFATLEGRSLFNKIKRNTPSDWEYKTKTREISKIQLLLERDIFSYPEMKEKLDLYLKQELYDQGIESKYDYGVFNEENGGLYIMNGNYAIPSFDTAATNIETQAEKTLTNTDYHISLWSPDEQLKVYFPNKTSLIWSSVLPEMFSSIIFTGLILFCFSYTIYVIFKQKKISEITNDFINNMTHEFKTPIATISLAADSIDSPVIISNEGKVKRFTNIIKQENKRMLNQVEKVLQMALLEKDDFELKKVEVNLNQLAEAACQNVGLQVRQREGEIKTELKADPATIMGDVTHISNIIHNLLDNANKYSPEKPEITVRTKNSNKGVTLEIEDKGLGLSKESQKNIFDKFYRVHTGNRHDVKGFGLGLSYVKAMMDAHKGLIKVNSELGKGSTFILFFPNNV